MEAVEQFNRLVKNENHFELQVYSFSPFKLVLAGNYELDYSHTVELHFEYPHFYSGKQHFVISDSSELPLRIGKQIPELDSLNNKYSIEEGFELFAISSNYGDVYVAAKSLHMLQKTVLYYKSENPGSEKIAYWLK
jgi:hypothetical protein